ncbi:Copia protein [Senna tora]|uniref:Copia protein n=1 Tax=Senna tora TaxID=362788 RepID=A0A834T328_9FABA|nr:Copia protein [Senna tora]
MSSEITSAAAASSTQGKMYALFNASSQAASVKLDRNNFLLWEAAVYPLIKGNRLLHHINATGVIPPAEIVQDSKTIPNPERNSPTQNECIIPFIIPGSERRQNEEDEVQKSTTASSLSPRGSLTESSSSTPSDSSTRGSSTSKSSGLNPNASESRDHLSDAHVHVEPEPHESAQDQRSNPQLHDSGPPSQAQQHVMVTRSRAGVFKPKMPYVGVAESKRAVVTEPSSVSDALSTPCWKQAMTDEYTALQRNNTWVLTLYQWGFKNAVSDISLFYIHSQKLTVFVLIYVDDIIVTGNNPKYLSEFIKRLNTVFALKDLGPLYYFLGLEVYRDHTGIYLNQGKYVDDVLKRLGMSECAEVSTPMVTGRKFTTEDGDKMKDPTLYRKAIDLYRCPYSRILVQL